MKSFINLSILFPIFLTVIVSVLFIPFFFTGGNIISSSESLLAFSDQLQSFLWPTKGYHTITSSFGYRVSPANGASSYHGGIDIGAPQGARITATMSGIVSFVGFNGANGYTVKIKHAGGYESTYGHVSPNFVVSVR